MGKAGIRAAARRKRAKELGRKPYYRFKAALKRKAILKQNPFYAVIMMHKMFLSRRLKRIADIQSEKKQSGYKLSYRSVRLQKAVEKKFLPDMNWANYGEGKGCWEVAYIIPLETVLTKPQLKKLLVLANIQPSWRKQTAIKEAKVLKNMPIPKENSKLTRIIAELSKRNESKIDLAVLCFPKQLAFIQDVSKYKLALCSRRSGKSTAEGLEMLQTAISFPYCNQLYITTSRAHAKTIIWPVLRQYNREFKLGGKLNESELSVTFPNESKIYVSGAHDRTEIEKFRGIMRLKKAFIDEMQSFPDYIAALINDVISPALLDLDGSLVLTGTPGPIPAGFFYNACTDLKQDWSRHAWTYFDNEFIAKLSGKTHDQLLQAELKKRGVGLDNPSIRREYFGEWVLDSDSLVFHYNSIANGYLEVPKELNNFVLGVDIGFRDADAIAVLGYATNSKQVYLVEEKITRKQDVSALAADIQMLRAKYNAFKIVMDAGALGKKIEEEFRRRFNIPVEAADKTRKAENIALLNDYLRTGQFKAKDNSMFAQDSSKVEYDYDKSTPDKLVVSKRFHSDITDAVLYAFKPINAFLETARIPKFISRTNAYWEAEAKKMEDAAEQHFKEDQDIAPDLFDEMEKIK